MPIVRRSSWIRWFGNLQDVDAVDDDLALGRQDLPEDDLEEGRLARAAGPGDEVEIAALGPAG